MKLTKEQLAMLETPCVILDVAQARRNIEAMQAAADAAAVRCVRTSRPIRWRYLHACRWKRVRRASPAPR